MEQPSYSQRILDLPQQCRDDMKNHSSDALMGYVVGQQELRDASAEIAKEADVRIKQIEVALERAQHAMKLLARGNSPLDYDDILMLGNKF